jgi:1,2-phenylacetyl-CoA epoxidase PaaB subunit
MAKNPEPPKLATWDVYRAAHKPKIVGSVQAVDADEAVQKAAQEFKVDAWRRGDEDQAWIKVRNPASIAVQRERSEKWNR